MKPTIPSLSERAQFRFQILEKVLDQLGDEQSRIILMHSRGYGLQQIARKLNSPEPKVASQLLAAKQEVRKLIKQYYT